LHTLEHLLICLQETWWKIPILCKYYKARSYINSLYCYTFSNTFSSILNIKEWRVNQTNKEVKVKQISLIIQAIDRQTRPQKLKYWNGEGFQQRIPFLLTNRGGLVIHVDELPKTSRRRNINLFGEHINGKSKNSFFRVLKIEDFVSHLGILSLGEN